jgi:hypothetical protein
MLCVLFAELWQRREISAYVSTIADIRAQIRENGNTAGINGQFHGMGK